MGWDGALNVGGYGISPPAGGGLPKIESELFVRQSWNTPSPNYGYLSPALQAGSSYRINFLAYADNSRAATTVINNLLVPAVGSTVAKMLYMYNNYVTEAFLQVIPSSNYCQWGPQNGSAVGTGFYWYGHINVERLLNAEVLHTPIYLSTAPVEAPAVGTHTYLVVLSPIYQVLGRLQDGPFRNHVRLNPSSTATSVDYDGESLVLGSGGISAVLVDVFVS